MKTDRQIIEQLHKALDGLHVTFEGARDNIFHWYVSDTFASTAREKALDALKAARDHRDAKPPTLIADDDGTTRLTLNGTPKPNHD
jgi:hypothetical protein